MTARLAAPYWFDRAACKDADPEIFFPLAIDHPDRAEARKAAAEALAYCRSCPAAAECRQWAITQGCGHGVFGGLLPAERRAAARREESTWLRRCRWCRAPFQVSHGKQVYCSSGCRATAAESRRVRGAPSAPRQQRSLGDDEALRAIAAFAGRGYSDRQTAAAIGLTRGQVSYLRGREGIPAGKPLGDAR